MTDDDAAVTVRLTRAEALVLFEWLATTSEANTLSFADKAEQIVLWNIEAELESVLVEPLESNYDELVAAARASVRADHSA